MEMAIRPYDVDVAGIVSNIVYVRWLEDIRTELFNQYLPLGELSKRHLMPVIARTEIDYRASLRYSDRCTGHAAVVRLGRTSITLRYSFRNADGKIMAEALQIAVLIDTTTAQPTPVPEDWRAWLDGMSVSPANNS